MNVEEPASSQQAAGVLYHMRDEKVMPIMEKTWVRATTVKVRHAGNRTRSKLERDVSNFETCLQN